MNNLLPGSSIDDRIAILTGHLLFWALLILSAMYCRERVIHADSAYYLFNILYDGQPYIAHNRWISIFSQWVPLLLRESGASLPTIVTAYSVALMGFNYLVFLILVYLIRHPWAGLALALSIVVANRYKFYTGISEIFSSISLVALLLGWLTRPAWIDRQWPPQALLAITVAVTGSLYLGHPFLFVPAMVLWGAVLILRDKWKDWQHWLVLLIMLLVAVFKYLAISENAYEANRLGSVAEALKFLTQFQEYYVWEVAQMYLSEEYYLPLLLFIAALAGLIRQNKWFGAIFLGAGWFLAFVLVLVLHTYLKGPYYNLLDGYLGIIGMIWAFAIVWWLKEVRSRLKWLAVSGLLIFSVVRIVDKSSFFTERRHQLEAQLAAQKGPKVLKSIYAFPWNKYWNPWAIPFETLLLSAWENPSAAKTVYYGDAAKLLDRLSLPDLFLADRHQYKPSRFPKHLFMLEETLYLRDE